MRCVCEVNGYVCACMHVWVGVYVWVNIINMSESINSCVTVEVSNVLVPYTAVYKLSLGCT